MKKNLIKKIASLSIISLFSFQLMYIFVEPTVTIAANPDDVIVTLNVTAGLTLSNGADVTMSPNIGLSANESIGSSSWVVATNSSGGYNLHVKASASPALVSGGNSFADYTPTGGVPDAWNVASGTKEFGFSAYGDDVLDGTWGTHNGCGAAGVPAAGSKYFGFTTSDKLIANRTTVTPLAGVTTNICFAAEQNGVYAPSGVYTATITATATAL